jgi:choline dehydrogenase-like flavoprotein
MADRTRHEAELTAFMDRSVKHLAAMFGFGEGMPLKDNRVELTSREGPAGTRLPQVVHGFAAESMKLWEQASALGMRVMEAAGASDPWHNPPASAHIMGGTIMGTTAANSVIENLIIAGPGLVPTGGAMNPNFTNHALSLRSAEHLLVSWPS